MDVELNSYWFWIASGVLFVDPFFKPLFGVYEHRYGSISHYLGGTVTFFWYCVTSYLFSFWGFLSLQNAISVHPRAIDLQRNEALLFGYFFFLSGVALKIYTYKVYGMKAVMGGQYFKLPSSTPKPEGKASDPYYNPNGTATVLCYFGTSLLRASIVGLSLTVCAAFGYFFACYFEKFYLKATKKQTLTSYIRQLCPSFRWKKIVA